MLGCKEDIDLQKELHNIYKMFLAGQDYLMKMKGSYCTLFLIAILAVEIYYHLP